MFEDFDHRGSTLRLRQTFTHQTLSRLRRSERLVGAYGAST